MLTAEELPQPLDVVRQLARNHATGELSWIAPDITASIYLEKGRIAWATSTAGRFSFARELAHRARIDPAVLRVIVDRCRVQRIPFGEALVQAGITSVETVRDLLKLQVCDALETLDSVTPRAPVFVARQPTALGYAEHLTFALDEVAPLERRRTRRVTLPPPAVEPYAQPQRRDAMANLKDTLSKIMEIDGALGCCAVDSNSGMMLGASGGAGHINLEVAAAGNTEVVRAKRKTMKALGLADAIDDILITLGRQYHIIRPLGTNDALFIYLVLDKSRGNLAMARLQLTSLERELSI